MKPVRSWTMLLIALGVVACSRQMPSGRSAPQIAAGPQMVAADAEAIRAVFDVTTDGWNRSELSAYLSAYTESATAMGSTGLVRGRNAIGDQMRAGYWRTGRPLQTLRYDHLEIRPLGPNYALATGQYILTAMGRPDRTGWFSTIWVRTAQGWRMMHDHSS